MSQTKEDSGNTMSDTPATVIRTRVYRGRWTPVLDEALTRCRHQQRAMYNRTINAVSPQGGAVPATMKSPGHPNGLYGQLTEWRGEVWWIADIAVALARRAVAQAREALKAHEGAVRARCARLLDESDAWTRWMVEHPGWDCGAWDALSTEEQRERAGEAPPRSASTWRDERGGDGSRTELYRRRKRTGRCAVSWHTPPSRVDAQTLRLAGLGAIEVRAPNGLPEASRMRAARVCVRKGRRGRCRVEVHLSVRVDVEGRAPGTEPPVAGADMGCADTLTLHDGSTLTLPEHEEALEKALDAQRAMSRCVRGSRQWKDTLACLRTQRCAMHNRDHDAVRKSARKIARAYEVLGVESLNIKGMGASARGRGGGGVAAKRALNRRIRAGLWGFTQTALANAMEAACGVALKLPAMDSSRTDAECGHVDAENRKGKAFRCIRCAHVDDADVNAAKVMRQRALRWLALKAAGHSDREATETLWKELRAARKESQRWGADRAEATTKPACAVESTRTHNGAAGAASIAPAGSDPPRLPPAMGAVDGDGSRRHEQCSQRSI